MSKYTLENFLLCGIMLLEAIMLKRKIEEKLNLWWSTNTALFVDGARQVGKTYSLERFAKLKSNNYVYLNFIEKSYVIPQIIKSNKTLF